MLSGDSVEELLLERQTDGRHPVDIIPFSPPSVFLASVEREKKEKKEERNVHERRQSSN